MTAPQGEMAIEIVAGPDTDADDLAVLTQRLRRELLLLDIEDARPSRAGAALPGAKSAELLGAGLVVALGMQRQLLRAVVDTVVAWLAREPGVVKLTVGPDTLEVSGTSTPEQRELIALWVERHAPPG